MTVDLEYAEKHFGDLAAAATRGEIVEIEVPPSAKLVLSAKRAAEPLAPMSRKHLLGAWEGKIQLPTDEEWAAMDKEIEDEMVNGPLFPDEADETAG